jgi:Tfp pilus assembly pilus retraction ATPase PilT
MTVGVGVLVKSDLRQLVAAMRGTSRDAGQLQQLNSAAETGPLYIGQLLISDVVERRERLLNLFPCR